MLAIHSMLLGSAPSVSMNSFTASKALSNGMNSPTGSGVLCRFRTHSRNRRRSALGSEGLPVDAAILLVDQQHAELGNAVHFQTNIDAALAWWSIFGPFHSLHSE